MNVFDKFLNADGSKQEKKTLGSRSEMWNSQKRKEIGMKREKLAINKIKEKLHRPNNFLHGVHFIEPVTGEICEADGLYVARNILCIVEIKSKNFDYMYGNTDTGYWYLEYDGRIVRSDNAFRQITRQMRIATANLSWAGDMYGIVFLNNRNKHARIDIVGNKLENITLELDASRIADFLNYLPENCDRSLVDHIRLVDKQNLESGLYD